MKRVFSSICPVLAGLLVSSVSVPGTASAQEVRKTAPVILLKLDDVTQKGANPAAGRDISQNFIDVVALLDRLEVPASFGIIANSLEKGTPGYFDWIRATRAKGHEFWFHGLTHQEFPKQNGRRVCEFCRVPYEDQKAHFEKAQALAREKLGFAFSTFGSPFNQTDGNTGKVLAEHPEFTSSFFGPWANLPSGCRLLERRIDLEVPIFKPNYAHLVQEYERIGKDLQYIVLQGHPNAWGGKQRAELAKIIGYLKSQGCTFMTPEQFRKVPLSADRLPETKPAKGVSQQKKPVQPEKPLPPPVEMPQLLKNPTFVDADGDLQPEMWHRSTGSEGSLARGKTEDGKRYLTLAVSEPGESVILQQFNGIPSGATNLTVAAKIRWSDIRRGKQGYMQGCVQLLFQNESGKKIGDYLSILSFNGSSPDWRIVGKTFAVPSGAARFRVQVALYSPKQGKLDVQWATAVAGDTPALPEAEELSKENAPEPPPPEADGPEFAGVRGVSMLGATPLDSLKPFRNLDKFKATRFQPEAGAPCKDAIRVEILDYVPAIWDMQLRATVQTEIKKGDVIRLSYWIRGIQVESEFAETLFLNAMQLDRAPWSKVFELKPRARIGKGWIPVQRVFVSPVSIPAGKAAFSFQFGTDKQIFEIGGLELHTYGKRLTKEDIPSIKPDLYEGHEEDAPWRAAAQARIEKIRKGDMTLVVRDENGKAIENARVRVEMKRHAFGWGSALYVWNYFGDSANARRYRETFLELFNLMVPENGLKWSSWDNDRNREETQKMVDWALRNGCEVRGHTLVWPSFRRNPPEIKEFKEQPEKLRAAIDAHIRDIATTMRGKIRAWDVMNEPTTNHEFMDLLGEAEIGRWWKLARECDPQAQLFLNENQILAETKLKSLEQYLDKILLYGGELGGIGVQGHMGVGTASPERILAIFDRLWGRYHVPISITELDVLSDNPEHQAMYLRDVLTAAFSHPACDSVTFWGFWDGRHWLKNCPLYREDWTPKPGLDVYKKLVFGDWWTRGELLTDTRGVASLRAFFGDYEVTVEVPGKAPVTQKVGFRKASAEPIVLTVP